MEATETPESASAHPLLDLRGVSVAFGGLLALSEVDLTVGLGERLAILGPNGAGKTTLFNVIAGDIPPTTGSVHIAGDDVTLKPSRVRPALGVARTYQKTRLFADLSVGDNLTLAAIGKSGKHRRLLRGPSSKELGERSRDAAARVWLTDVYDTHVADLSHGQRRQLEVGMAVVTQPRLMLLDEPASGLSRGERERLVDLIEALEGDMTLILIEHDMDVALRVAERVMVMSDGRKLSEGTPESIREDPVVQEIYLGTRS